MATRISWIYSSVLLTGSLLAACSMGTLEPEFYEVQTLEVETMKKYKNDPAMHIPEGMIGNYTVTESGEVWELSKEGISMPTSTMLYPNPVTSEMFLAAVDGVSLEEVEKGRYSFSASGRFEYKGNLYFGDCVIEIVIDVDSITVNGREAVRG